MASLQIANAAAKDAAAKDAALRVAACDAVWCAGIDAYDAWVAARDATFARPGGATEWPAIRDEVVAKNQSDWRDRVAALTLTRDAVIKDYYEYADPKKEDFSNKGKLVDISEYVTNNKSEENTEPVDYEKMLVDWRERFNNVSDHKKLCERYGMDGYSRGDEREDDYDYEYDDYDDFC